MVSGTASGPGQATGQLVKAPIVLAFTAGRTDGAPSNNGVALEVWGGRSRRPSTTREHGMDARLAATTPHVACRSVGYPPRKVETERTSAVYSKGSRPRTEKS